MPPSAETATLTVALIGNPNTGKSTLFSALVGIHQHVGNYPGVTVEKKTGHMNHDGHRYELIDLPGLYSLAPRSRDEMVAVDVLLGRHGHSAVDTVICVVDAVNLERNLYLVGQVLEFGRPTIVAVNMLDVAENRGVKPDLQRLQQQLGVPVVGIQANRQLGIPELKQALARCLEEHLPQHGHGMRQRRRHRRGHHRPTCLGGPTCGCEAPFPTCFEDEVSQIEQFLAENGTKRPLPRCLVRRLLLDGNGYLEKALLTGSDDPTCQRLAAARTRLAEAGCAVPGIETTSRYDWVHRVLDGVVGEHDHDQTTGTDRIDHVLTHRLWGTVVFAALMLVVFQAVFTWAAPLMELAEGAFAALGEWTAARMPGGALSSLLVDGVIAGVGGVVVFLPQILILFLFIAVLEDCGYMARAAFLMDRLMVRVGLSGKSFIPMLSSFACAVPGIMAARVIENERDRLTTILVAPLMTCSARLPVYALLIAAFIPSQTYFGGLLNLQGVTLAALYLLGIIVAIVAALVLKKTILRGETPPFVLELPSYKWPSPRTVFFRLWNRCWAFLRTAGTMILAVSIMVWAALYYPRNSEQIESQPQIQQLRAELAAMDASAPQHAEAAAELDRELAGAHQRQSYLGRAGHLIEPVVRPLGWDWRIGCAVVASFPAREVVVATLGVIYNLGEEVDPETEKGSEAFRAKLRSATWDGSDPPRKVFNVPVALSIMVFFALCAQCAATLAVIRRETNSWRWPAFTFAYMTTLAYVGALATYQVGMWISG